MEMTLYVFMRDSAPMGFMLLYASPPLPRDDFMHFCFYPWEWSGADKSSVQIPEEEKKKKNQEI